MIKIVLFSAIVAACHVAVLAGIVGQYHSLNDLHGYAIGYFGGPSTKHERKVNNIKTGGYSYVDANGRLQTGNFTSDKHGLRVSATNLPVPVNQPTAPASQTVKLPKAPSQPSVPAHHLIPPPAHQPQIIFYPALVPAEHPVFDLAVSVPASDSDALKRSRRSPYSSYASIPATYAQASVAYVPASVTYTPSKTLRHSSIALESTHVSGDYTRAPRTYAAVPEPYALTPKAYAPESETYALAHAPTPKAYDSEPETYNPPSEAYSPAPKTYASAPKAYDSVPETYNPPSEAYSPAAKAYAPTPKAYDSVPETYNPPSEIYSPAPKTYAPAPKTYAPVPETYVSASETYSPAPKAYASAPKIYTPVPRTYPLVSETYSPAPTAYIQAIEAYNPASKTYAPKIEAYNPVASSYAYVKPVPKPASPVEYVKMPSYESKYSVPRSHIPIEEETNDIPEDKRKPVAGASVAAVKLFVPVTTTTTTTTTPVPNTPPPSNQFYSPSSSYYAPPAEAPSYYHLSTPAPTPAQTPVTDVYNKPAVGQSASLAETEHNPFLRHAPTSTLPPTTTPAPSTPGYVETYFIPKDPAPHLSVAPAPVILPSMPLPAVVATPLRSQFHSQDELGQYAFGYANELSSKTEVKTADGVTHGQYSYVDANGQLQQVHYTSDAQHGFRVAATNLPKGPVVPELKK